MPFVLREVRDIYLNGLNGDAKQAADRNTGLMALPSTSSTPITGLRIYSRTNSADAIRFDFLAFPNESGLLDP